MEFSIPNRTLQFTLSIDECLRGASSMFVCPGVINISCSKLRDLISVNSININNINGFNHDFEPFDGTSFMEPIFGNLPVTATIYGFTFHEIQFRRGIHELNNIPIDCHFNLFIPVNHTSFKSIRPSFNVSVGTISRSIPLDFKDNLLGDAIPCILVKNGASVHVHMRSIPKEENLNSKLQENVKFIVISLKFCQDIVSTSGEEPNERISKELFSDLIVRPVSYSPIPEPDFKRWHDKDTLDNLFSNSVGEQLKASPFRISAACLVETFLTDLTIMPKGGEMAFSSSTPYTPSRLENLSPDGVIRANEINSFSFLHSRDKHLVELALAGGYPIRMQLFALDSQANLMFPLKSTSHANFVDLIDAPLAVHMLTSASKILSTKIAHLQKVPVLELTPGVKDISLENLFMKHISPKVVKKTFVSLQAFLSDFMARLSPTEEISILQEGEDETTTNINLRNIEESLNTSLHTDINDMHSNSEEKMENSLAAVPGTADLAVRVRKLLTGTAAVNSSSIKEGISSLNELTNETEIGKNVHEEQDKPRNIVCGAKRDRPEPSSEFEDEENDYRNLENHLPYQKVVNKSLFLRQDQRNQTDKEDDMSTHIPSDDPEENIVINIELLQAFISCFSEINSLKKKLKYISQNNSGFSNFTTKQQQADQVMVSDRPSCQLYCSVFDKSDPKNIFNEILFINFPESLSEFTTPTSPVSVESVIKSCGEPFIHSAHPNVVVGDATPHAARSSYLSSGHFYPPSDIPETIHRLSVATQWVSFPPRASTNILPSPSHLLADSVLNANCKRRRLLNLSPDPSLTPGIAGAPVHISQGVDMSLLPPSLALKHLSQLRNHAVRIMLPVALITEDKNVLEPKQVTYFNSAGGSLNISLIRDVIVSVIVLEVVRLLIHHYPSSTLSILKKFPVLVKTSGPRVTSILHQHAASNGSSVSLSRDSLSSILFAPSFMAASAILASIGLCENSEVANTVAQKETLSTLSRRGGRFARNTSIKTDPATDLSEHVIDAALKADTVACAALQNSADPAVPPQFAPIDMLLQIICHLPTASAEVFSQVVTSTLMQAHGDASAIAANNPSGFAVFSTSFTQTSGGAKSAIPRISSFEAPDSALTLPDLPVPPSIALKTYLPSNISVDIFDQMKFVADSWSFLLPFVSRACMKEQSTTVASPLLSPGQIDCLTLDYEPVDFSGYVHDVYLTAAMMLSVGGVAKSGDVRLLPPKTSPAIRAHLTAFDSHGVETFSASGMSTNASASVQQVTAGRSGVRRAPARVVGKRGAAKKRR